MSTDVVSPLSRVKLADTHPRVHGLIRSRWSPRAFSSEEVSTEDLKALLEAARWAASSYNEQPWRFYVATKSDPEGYARLLDALVPFNQAWAGKAPVLIIMAAKKTFSHNGAPNYYALHDAGQALAYLMLEATALGLYTHAMAGFDHEKARKAIGLPDDYDLAAAVVVGHLGDPAALTVQMRDSESAKRERKPLSEVAFGSRFNQPLNL